MGKRNCSLFWNVGLVLPAEFVALSKHPVSKQSAWATIQATLRMLRKQPEENQNFRMVRYQVSKLHLGEVQVNCGPDHIRHCCTRSHCQIKPLDTQESRRRGKPTYDRVKNGYHDTCKVTRVTRCAFAVPVLAYLGLVRLGQSTQNQPITEDQSIPPL